MKSSLVPVLVIAAFGAGIAVGRGAPAAQPQPRLFELRTYTSPPGKLPELHRRFREHTTALFAKHGMTNVGYWTPQDSARSQNTIIYLLAFPNRQARTDAWAAFGRDTTWQRVRAASEVNGRIVEKVESVFLEPTDYSPMK